MIALHLPRFGPNRNCSARVTFPAQKANRAVNAIASEIGNYEAVLFDRSSLVFIVRSLGRKRRSRRHGLVGAGHLELGVRAEPLVSELVDLTRLIEREQCLVDLGEQRRLVLLHADADRLQHLGVLDRLQPLAGGLRFIRW